MNFYAKAVDSASVFARGFIMQGHKVLSVFAYGAVKHVFSYDTGNAREILTESNPYGINGQEVTRYCNVIPLINQIKMNFTSMESIHPVCNSATYQIFTQGRSVYNMIRDDDSHPKLIVCIQEPRRGGNLIIRPSAHDSTTLTLRTGMAVLLSKLTKYDVSAVSSGTLVLAIIDIAITSMRDDVILQGDTVFSSSYNIFNSPSCVDVCAAFRLVVDDISKESICEQVMINGEWCSILQVVSSGKRVIIWSKNNYDTHDIHHDEVAFVPHIQEKHKDRAIQKLVSILPPYASANKSVHVYGNNPKKVCNIYLLYVRLIGANV